MDAPWLLPTQNVTGLVELSTNTRRTLVVRGSRYSTNCPFLGFSRAMRSLSIEPVHASPLRSIATSYGPDHGVGSTYHWAGNKKAGEGEMAITGSTPTSVVVDLVFLKPFKATNVTRFDLAPVGDATDVTWTMTGTRSAIMSVAGKLVFDKAIGKDFDRGLADLKTQAERGA